MSAFKIKRVYRRFWWWSAQPYARDRGLLWVKLVIGYRYFADDLEVTFP